MCKPFESYIEAFKMVVNLYTRSCAIILCSHIVDNSLRLGWKEGVIGWRDDVICDFSFRDLGISHLFAEISGLVLFSSDISGLKNLFRSPIFLYFASEISGFFTFSSDISRFFTFYSDISGFFLKFRNFTPSCSLLFRFALQSAAGARSQLATKKRRKTKHVIPNDLPQIYTIKETPFPYSLLHNHLQ